MLKNLKTIGKRYKWAAALLAVGVSVYAGHESLPAGSELVGALVALLGLREPFSWALAERIYERIGATVQKHDDLATAVQTNKTACDQIALTVGHLSLHVRGHHDWIVSYSSDYQAPEAPLPAG